MKTIGSILTMLEPLLGIIVAGFAVVLSWKALFASPKLIIEFIDSEKRPNTDEINDKKLLIWNIGNKNAVIVDYYLECKNVIGRLTAFSHFNKENEKKHIHLPIVIPPETGINLYFNIANAITPEGRKMVEFLGKSCLPEKDYSSLLDLCLFQTSSQDSTPDKINVSAFFENPTLRDYLKNNTYIMVKILNHKGKEKKRQLHFFDNKIVKI